MIPIAGFRLHHFGLAARDPKRALAALAALGYLCGTPLEDPIQNVVLHWCTRADTIPVEVVSAMGEAGPLKRVLAEQDTSFYHLCYEIDTTEAALERLKQAGLRVLTVLPACPAVLFDGRRVSFHLLRGFGLIELLERA